jgi:hypothetical protein
MKFVASDQDLTITLEGVEVFFGLKRRLVIPRSSITGLEWRPDFIFEGKLWRMVGSGIPGLLYAGHFRADGQRYYLYLQQPTGVGWVNGIIRAQNVLVITTQDFGYKQIFLTCNPEVGAGLLNWWHQR